MTRRQALLFVLMAVIVGAGVTALVVLVSVNRGRGPQPVTLSAAVDDPARAAIGRALVDYNARAGRYSASLLPGKGDTGNLVLGPYQEGGVAWRSLGWRLWARLEMLGKLEGDLKHQLTVPLREGRVDIRAFQAMMDEVRRAGVTPLVLPRSPSSYSWAMEQYLGRVGGQTTEWEKRGWLVKVGDLRAAIDSLDRNRAAFLLGSDTMGGFLGRNPDSHPEGFPLPGSRSPGATWVLGRGEGFLVPESGANKEGAKKAGAIDQHI